MSFGNSLNDKASCTIVQGDRRPYRKPANIMKITYNKIEYTCSDIYSFKDFTGQGNLEVSGIIYASCFSQEDLDRHIFPNNMKGVTFIKCNLMNVFIPSGNIIIDCNTNRFQVQNDLNDWIIDLDNKPIEPIDAKIFIKLGLPIPNPKDIPTTKVDVVIDLKEVAKTNLTLKVIK